MNNTDENLIKLFIQKYKNAKDDNERKALFLDQNLIPDRLLEQAMLSLLVEYWQSDINCSLTTNKFSVNNKEKNTIEDATFFFNKKWN